MSYGKRNIKNGSKYNSYFPTREEANSNYKVLHASGDVFDTVKAMSKIIKADAWQTEKIAPLLQGKNTCETCKNIHQFMMDYLQYDMEQGEKLRSPARTWWDGQNGGDPKHGGIGVDCDDMSIFAGSILHNLNIPYYIRIVKIDSSDFQHVYLIIPEKNKSNYITLDGVVHKFNYETPFKDEVTFNENGEKMKIEYLGDVASNSALAGIKKTNEMSFAGFEINGFEAGVFIPQTEEEIKLWFEELYLNIQNDPDSVKILINPQDALDMLKGFLDVYDNNKMRLQTVEKWAQIEKSKMLDAYFWKMVLWFYKGEVDFSAVINDNYIKVAKELREEPELIDSSLTSPEGLGAFNPIYHERKNAILWFCDAGHFTGGKEWKGKTFVKLSAYGETANNRFKVGRKITLVNTVNNYYDGEFEVKDWIAKSQRGVDNFNKALGRHKITGFCIDKTPLKEGYHGGFFPDMTNVSWNLWYEAKDKAGYWMPKHLGQESEHKVGNWSHSGKAIVDHFRNKNDVLKISKIVIPPSEKLSFKNIIWALPRQAVKTLVSQFNFANIGIRYIIGEVGFEVAEQAGISYNDWAKAARWKNGSTKKIIDFWTKTAAGQYYEIQTAAWAYVGAKRKSLIDKLKKHPNFNYYRNMNHQTNQPSGSHPTPPQSPKLSGAGIGLGQLQAVTTAPEFYNTDLFDYDEGVRGLGAISESALAIISSPALVEIFKALKALAGSIGVSKECTDLVDNFIGESEKEIEDNPNYDNALACGQALLKNTKAPEAPKTNTPPPAYSPPVYAPPSPPPPPQPQYQPPQTQPQQQVQKSGIDPTTLIFGASAIGAAGLATYLATRKNK
jgi:hypothetical protein